MKASDIVRARRISIPPVLWRSMRARMSRGEIKQRISLAVKAFRIPPPMVALTAADAKNGFEALCRLDTSPLLKNKIWHARYNNYRLKPTSWRYIQKNRTGAAASNYFHQTSRWQCAGKFPSPMTVWANDRLRRTVLGALLTLKATRVSTSTLRSVIELRSYIAAQFNVASAKAIYDYFKAKRVLDFCAGWGDRLAAFHACASTRLYVGIDPNTALHDGYARQAALYNTGKACWIIPAPAEDVDLSEYRNKFDLCFTSPPYFSAEHYSDDPAQSWRRYSDIDAWLNGFLFVALRRAYEALRPGGYLVINLADTEIDGTVVHLCDPMNEFLAELGCVYENCWGA